MGLNEVYIIVRGNILMMTPLPAMGQAFALLVQEEKQRKLWPTNHTFGKSSSIHMSVGGGMSIRRNFQTNYVGGGSSVRRHFWTNYVVNNYNEGERNRPFCDHCEKLGHTKEKC